MSKEVVETFDLTTSKSSFSVKVTGWGSPRVAAVKDGFLFFQAVTCFPCPICENRVIQLDSGLERTQKGKGVEKRHIDKLLFFVFPLPSDLTENSSPVEFCSFLSSVFDLPILLLEDSHGKPLSLPIKRVEFKVTIDDTDSRWSSNDSLEVSPDGKTVEWKDPSHRACWIACQTNLCVGNGSYVLDFEVHTVPQKQLGVGFLLAPPDWGFFGYLGASPTAWSYDVRDGAIVNTTKAIHENLPVIESKGIVSLELNLEAGSSTPTARFVVDGTITPVINLPARAIVIPAVSLLAHGQKVVIKSFSKK